MPRKLSPAGEEHLRAELGEDAEDAIRAINEWAPPPPHNHRCNEPPIGECGPFLRRILGDEDGNFFRDLINLDAERFAKSRADRMAAQGLQFPNRAKPITPEKVEYLRKKNAERQANYRKRVREVASGLPPRDPAMSPSPDA